MADAVATNEFEAMRALARFGAVLLLAASVGDALDPSLVGAGRTVIVVFDVVCLVVALGCAFLPARRLAWVHVATMMFACLTSANAISTIFVTRDMIATVHLGVILLGTASVLLSSRLYFAYALAAVVGWAAVALPHATVRDTVNYSIILVGAAGVGLTALMARSRAVKRVAILRYREIRRRSRLERTVVDVRDELVRRERIAAEDESLRERLLQAQKLEAIGTLAGGVAHDMNNVLAGIVATMELLRDEVSGRSRDDITAVLEAAERGAALTRNLLTFARKSKQTLAPLAVCEIADKVQALLRRSLRKEISLEVERPAPRATVQGDENLLYHALVNLCLNAADAIEGEGTITIVIAEETLAGSAASGLGLGAGSYVVVSVRDTGSGMDEATRQRVFEPFFSTKAPGKGTGLGLPMVYGTAKSHGGTVTVESALARGTTVRVYFPSVAPAVAPSLVTPPPRVVGRGRILVVDDEPLVRRGVRGILKKRGYEVVEADGGVAAVELVDGGAHFDAVVLDMAMPNLNGAVCFVELRKRMARLPIVLMSGHAQTAEVTQLLDAGEVAFLEKPFEGSVLDDTLRRLLGIETTPAPVSVAREVGGAVRPAAGGRGS
ncbi:MAG: response regulator [Polyangiaceae bacterium]